VINGITGLKLTNNVGVNNVVDTKSWVNAGSNILNHNISVYENNTLEQICLTTLTLNTNSASFTPAYAAVY
jgi:biotin synthase-like enzyme